MTNIERADAIVVGAGFAGLVTSLELLQRGVNVLLIESSPRPGGRLSTDSELGFLCEWAAESFLCPSSDPAWRWLLEHAGSTLTSQSARASAKRRYVVRDGSLVELGPGMLFGSGLLSARGRLALLAGALSPRRGPPGETLAAFARRRFGPEAVANLITPMASGVYAGDPEALGLAEAFPRMAAFDQGRGLLGALFKRRGPRRETLSFAGGMGALTKALGERLGERLRLSEPLLELSRNDGGFELTTGSASATRRYHAARLVLATPAYVSAEICGPLSKELSEALSELPYADIAVVGLGYEDTQIRAPVTGFGALRGEDRRPQSEAMASLGVLFSSQIFDGRAPAGHQLFRLMFGGVREPERLELDDPKLSGLARKDLKNLLGVTGSPRFERVFRHRRGIPQYEVSHSARRTRIFEALSEVSGLFLTGNAYHGAGLSDVLRAGLRCAEVVSASLTAAGRSE
jgi:protoporphyrinogen/coproporphyrinogen III oxidase